MTPEEFRAAAHELVDWITDRRIEIEARPVRPAVEPGDIAARLPSTRRTAASPAVGRPAPTWSPWSRRASPRCSTR